MVWGMSLPRGGGPYGPYGEYEGEFDHHESGWGRRLRLYLLHEMSKEQQETFKDDKGNYIHSYPSFVWGKLTNELGTTDGPGQLHFTAIEEHEPPIFFQTEKGFESLASIISLPGRVWAVDEPMKTIIERLEPGCQEFYPFEMRMPRGKVYPVRYYALVFRQYIDSLAPEKCKDGALRLNGPQRYYSDDSKKAITGRAFSKAKFGNAHLWRERAFGDWFTCFSDELHGEIENAGLLMPKHYRMIEV